VRPSPLYGYVTAAVAACALLAGCAECEGDFDCPGIKVCSSEGTCEAFVCAVSSDCPPTQACSQNRCVSRPAPPTPAEADAFIIEAPPL